MIKKFFKFIFGLIIFVIILVVVAIVGVIIAFTDKTDNAPIDKYDTTLTTETVLANQLSKSLNSMGETYTLDLIFDEDTLNQLLFAFVRKSLNPDFNPAKEGASAKEKYAYSFELPSDLPVVGGKAMGLKNIYGEIDGEYVTINITGDVDEKIKTRIYLTFSAETTETEYILKIKELKVGKVNATSDFIKKILNTAGLDLNSVINPALEKTNLPFKFNYDNLTLSGSKKDFSDWVNSLLNKEEGEASTSDMKSEFLGLFLSPERSLINFGMFSNGFGLSINLNGLKVEDASKTTLDEAVKVEFNMENEMANKAQSLIMSSLANTSADKYLTFSELDFSRLIYSNMEGYKDFLIETEILAGVNFKFAVEGITFDITKEGKELDINIILNVNGLKTTAVLVGDIEKNPENDKEILIKLADKIKLGKDMEIGSAFMTDMLKKNFADSTIMKFDDAKNALVFSTDVFNTFMKEAMGSNNANLEVSKLEFVEDALRIYVTFDSAVGDQIATVTTLINDVLKDGLTLDTNEFAAEDVEKVAAVQEELTNMSTKLQGGTLTEEDTAALMDSISELSTESQAAFFEQVTDSIPAEQQEELSKLYASMFGNN